MLGACAPLPQRAGIPTEWFPSPSHDERRPNFIILHHTGADTAEHSLRTLTTRAREVSAHYLVGRDGTIWQLVDERARAWHAGESYWAGMTDLNSASIGIELDNDADEPFAEAQIVSLLALLGDITARYHMPRGNILGHGDIAPVRKVDPSRYFPWQRLAREGYGLWCDPPYPVATADPVLLLAALGYDMREPRAAMAAFRRHFRGDDSGELDEDDATLLECLVRKRALTPG